MKDNVKYNANAPITIIGFVLREGGVECCGFCLLGQVPRISSIIHN